MIKKAAFIILLCLTCFSWIFASDCPRRCRVWVYADERYNAGLNDVISAFQEAAKTEYFTFVYWNDFEYLVSVEYHIFSDGISVPSWETDEQGRRRIVDKGPYRSLLLLGLWFVAGKPQDQGPGYGRFDHNFGTLMKSWASWSEETDPVAHKVAILSQIQTTPPLHEVAWDYEQMPVTIEMEPEKECVEYGEEIKIDMKNFRDEKGRPTEKYFNRFVFTTEHGEIQLFGENKIGEKEWADSIVKAYHQYKAPNADECGDCDEDTITVYNSCDVLDPDVYPYSQTRKREKIHELKIDIGCDWEGTIVSTFKADAKEGETVFTQLEGSKSQSNVNWRLDVIFKLDRGNERVKIYELKSAKFTYSDVDDYTAVNAQKEIIEALLYSKEEAEVRGRNLTRSECNLELLIDLKKKTYKIEGILNVENIPGKGESRLKMIVPPTGEVHDEKKSGGGTEDHKEEILIEGEFSEDNPEVLQGSEDMFEGWTIPLKLYAEALRGQMSGKIHWKLKRKGKH